MEFSPHLIPRLAPPPRPTVPVPPLVLLSVLSLAPLWDLLTRQCLHLLGTRLGREVAGWG